MDADRRSRTDARGFTHLDEGGRARMVDVSEKPATARRAIAEGFVRLARSTVAALREGRIEKGDALAVARVAGIQAAKRAAEWIPLCHPIRIDAVTVALQPEDDGVRVRAHVSAHDRTGVEMEALTAVAGAALALYDMVKSIDRGAQVESIRLMEKEGGRSGTWKREV
jgi:cyclic pyranopterin phosphate synthase